MRRRCTGPANFGTSILAVNPPVRYLDPATKLQRCSSVSLPHGRLGSRQCQFTRSSSVQVVAMRCASMGWMLSKSALCHSSWCALQVTGTSEAMAGRVLGESICTGIAWAK